MTPKKYENQYLKREIEGKTNLEIVVMLYDAGLKFMKQAVSAIEEKNIEESHKKIIKAQNIVVELTNMLDMEKGGDISKNLKNLYSFINDRLMNANINKDIKSIEEASDIFQSLREPWVELAKKDKEGSLDVKSKEDNDEKPDKSEGKSKKSRILNGGYGKKDKKDGDEKTPRKPFKARG